MASSIKRETRKLKRRFKGYRADGGLAGLKAYARGKAPQTPAPIEGADWLRRKKCS